MPTMKLPLTPGFFKCPPLSIAEINHLKQDAYANAMDVVHKSLLKSGAIKWSAFGSESALKFYKGEDSNAPSGQTHVCVGKSEVAGTIDEVVDLFRNDTKEQAKEYVNRFGRDLLDAANLYSIVEPNEENPNERVGIAWYAVKSPLKKLILERDACMLESHYEFELNGKRGWVRAMKSVNLMCCPDLQHLLGLVRMNQTGTGHVFMEADRPGYISMTYVIQGDFGGTVTEWGITKAMKRRCRSLLDIELFLRENRLAKARFLSEDSLIPKSIRRECFLCQKKYGSFSTKTNCRICGEVFCSACSHTWNVKRGGISMRIDACTKCSLAPASSTSSSSSMKEYIPSKTARNTSNASTKRSTPGRPQALSSPNSASSSSSTDRTQQKHMYYPSAKERMKERWLQELQEHPWGNEDERSGIMFSPTQLAPFHQAKCTSTKVAPEDEIPLLMPTYNHSPMYH